MARAPKPLSQLSPAYRARIERRLQEGFTRSQARGHAGKGQKSITEARRAFHEPAPPRPGRAPSQQRAPLPGPRNVIVHGYVRDVHHTKGGQDYTSMRQRTIKVPISGEQRQQYEQYLADDRPNTAMHYLLGEVYGGGAASMLVGGPFDEDIDYDDPDYDDEDFGGYFDWTA